MPQQSLELFNLSSSTPESAFAHGRAFATGVATATAEFRRGIDLSAGVQFQGQVSGEVGEQIEATFSGRLQAGAGLALQAAFPLDLFNQAGMVARFQAQAAASASVAATVSLQADEFRRLVRERLDGPLEELLGIFFEEVEVEAGVWGRAAFAAEIVGRVIFAGSLLSAAQGGAGFTFTVSFNAGYGYGAGAQFIANIGFEDPRRLLERLADATTRLITAEVETHINRLPVGEAKVARPALAILRAVLPLATRSLFQLGLELATAQGEGAAGRAASTVARSFVRQAQELVLGALGDLAIQQLTALLGRAEVVGPLASLSAEERTRLAELLTELRTQVTELSSLQPADVNRWLQAVVDCVPPVEAALSLGLVPDGLQRDVRHALATFWAAGVLAARVVQAASEISGGTPFGGVLAPVPDSSGIAAHIAKVIHKEEPGTGLTLADLVEFLVGVDPVEELRASLPEVADVLDWLVEALGSPAGQLVQQVLQDLADPDTEAVEALLTTLGEAAGAAVRDEIVPRLLEPIKARDPDNVALALFIDELVVPSLIALPVVVLPNLAAAGDPAGRLRLREAVSALLLQSLGQFAVATTDVLLDHGLRGGAQALRAEAQTIARLGEESASYTLLFGAASRAFLPITIWPEDAAGIMELAAEVAELQNEHSREPLLDAVRHVLALGLSTEATRQASLQALTSSDDPPRQEDLEQILDRVWDGAWRVLVHSAPRLLELFLRHFVNEAKAIARLIGEGAREIVRATEQAVAWLGQQIEELRRQLEELVRRGGELLLQITGDVRALVGHLRAQSFAVIERIRAHGRSLIEPLIAGFPGWARDALLWLYNALFDAVRWLLDAPLRLLDMVAGWVEEVLTARLGVASYDEQAVRTEVRQRITSSGQAALSFDLGLEVWGVKVFDLGRVTIPGEAVLGAVADTTLTDQVFTQTVRHSAQDAVELQGVRSQQTTVGQRLDGALDQAQAQAAATRLTPGAPLGVRFLGVAQGARVGAPATVRIRVEGANRTFVEPTLGVPRRVTVIANGREYSFDPASWAEVAGGIEVTVRVIDATPFTPQAYQTAPTEPLQVLSVSQPTAVQARLLDGRDLEVTAAGEHVRARPEDGQPRIRPLDVLDAAEVLGGRSAVAEAILRARAAGGGAFLEEPVAVLATGAAFSTEAAAPPTRMPSLPGTTTPLPAGVIAQPAPVGTDRVPELAGQPGINVVQVAVADGNGLDASESLGFFLRVDTPSQPRVVIEQLDFAPPGPDWEGEYVLLRSTAADAVDLTGWTLRDLARHVFRFPAFTLAPGASVRVWTGPGIRDAENLYWGRRAAVWNNRGDTAVLTDHEGREVDRHTYPEPENSL